MQPDTIPQAFALFQAGDSEAALSVCGRIMATEPDNSRALLLCGMIASQRSQFPQAAELLQRSIDADPDEPVAYKRLALVQQALGQTDEALRTLRIAVDRAPHRGDGWKNLHGFLVSLGRHEEVRRLQVEMSDLEARRMAVDARYDAACALLRQGRFEEGWRSFEARLEKPEFKTLLDTPLPRWRGEPLAGKSILVCGEQGHGDHLQFFRYVQPLLDRGARVGVETTRPLARLFAGNTPAEIIVRSVGGSPEGYDCYCPMMSLPLAFDTRLGSIPGKTPYLAADAALAQRWRERLGARGPLRVGLAWAGGQRLLLPALVEVDRRRSLHFSMLEPLLDLPGMVFCSLQLDRPSEQAAPAVAAGRLLDWTDALGDFADTAALVDALDLVITADTAVAHLAGAMNKPTWILSRHDGCWRWLEDRDDTPWYPSVRLFRQLRAGDWDEVLARVRRALAAFPLPA